MLVLGKHDDATLEQFREVAGRAVEAALMADGHKGYIMPIGGVAAYRNQVSIPGVGVDIACGNCAVQTSLRLDPGIRPRELVKDERDWWQWLADEIQHQVSFGMGRKNAADDAPVDHFLFESDAWGLLPTAANPQNLKGKARSQLGTVGSGNHFVDVFVDEDGWVWVGVHFGSRGLGFAIANGFWNLANGDRWDRPKPEEKEALVSLDTQLGQDYWALMTLAGEYAYAGREWVARKVMGLIGAQGIGLVHNHHNFAWKEHHFGEDLIVVRKGATPAFPRQKGFIGGSMGDDAVIVEGADPAFLAELGLRGSAERVDLAQQGALYSTVHGAGRVMSRTQAGGKYKGWGHKRKLVRPGEVSWEMLQTWLAEKGVMLRGGGLDESPHAYRRLTEVLVAQGPTIDVLHTLRPLIVVMAGADEYDPYKD